MRNVMRILAPLCSLVASGAGHGWAAGYSSYKAVAYLGDKAPGGATFVDNFQAGAISDQGEVAFISAYPADNSEGLYLASADRGIIAIVQPGIPATDGWTFMGNGPIQQIIGPVSMNAAGDIAFGSDIQKGNTIGAGNFIWRRATNTFTKLSEPGDPAPGGGTFGDVTGQCWCSLNDRGDALFQAFVPDPNGDPGLGQFLRAADGTFSAIVRPGEASPEGGVFSLPRHSRGTVNALGQVAFRADVTKGADTWTGVYLFDSGKIKPLVTPATDAPGGGKFTQAIDPRLNDNGQIAFMGETAAGLGVYLYEIASGQIKALATPGMTLPGGGKLDGAATSECALAINAAGAVAMLLKVDDGSMGVYTYHDGLVDGVAHAGMTLPGVGAFDTAEHCVAIGKQGDVAFQANLHDDRKALVLATPAP